MVIRQRALAERDADWKVKPAVRLTVLDPSSPHERELKKVHMVHLRRMWLTQL